MLFFPMEWLECYVINTQSTFKCYYTKVGVCTCSCKQLLVTVPPLFLSLSFPSSSLSLSLSLYLKKVHLYTFIFPCISLAFFLANTWMWLDTYRKGEKEREGGRKVFKIIIHSYIETINDYDNTWKLWPTKLKYK